MFKNGAAAVMPLILLGFPATAEGAEFKRLEMALAAFAAPAEGLAVEAGCEAEGPRDPAADAGLCGDLYSFACAPGKWNDGTGSAGGGEAVRGKVRAAKESLAKKATKDFAAQIASPKGAYLRRLALSAFGLTNAPGCGEGAGNCDRVLAEALGRQVGQNLFPSRGPGGGPRPASLRGLDLLTQNAQYRKIEKTYKAEARAGLHDRANEEKIERKIFPAVQALLTDLVRRKVPDPAVRELLVTKIAGIEFDGSDCAAPVPPDATGESYTADLSALLEPNAYYTPAKNAFRFCNGFFLRNQSEFQMAGVVAHELAHAIDPCLIAQGPADFRFAYSAPMDRARSEAEYPLPNLLACLRSEGSVAASSQPPASPPAGAPAEDPAFAPPPPANAFCDQDQIGESVADWVSNEILPAYVKSNHPKLSRDQRQTGYANVFRGMCTEAGFAEEIPWDVHPDPARRANRLLLAQPEVRRQMGCPLDPPTGVTYCEVPDVRSSK